MIQNCHISGVASYLEQRDKKTELLLSGPNSYCWGESFAFYLATELHLYIHFL